MSKPASARPPIVASCIASSLLVALIAMPARAQDERIPNFAPDDHTGWLKPPGDEFIQPEHGPGPVKSDVAKPYIGRNIQAQETVKIAGIRAGERAVRTTMSSFTRGLKSRVVDTALRASSSLRRTISG